MIRQCRLSLLPPSFGLKAREIFTYNTTRSEGLPELNTRANMMPFATYMKSGVLGVTLFTVTIFTKTHPLPYIGSTWQKILMPLDVLLKHNLTGETFLTLISLLRFKSITNVQVYLLMRECPALEVDCLDFWRSWFTTSDEIASTFRGMHTDKHGDIRQVRNTRLCYRFYFLAVAWKVAVPEWAASMGNSYQYSVSPLALVLYLCIIKTSTLA